MEAGSSGSETEEEEEGEEEGEGEGSDDGDSTEEQSSRMVRACVPVCTGWAATAYSMHC